MQALPHISSFLSTTWCIAPAEQKEQAETITIHANQNGTLESCNPLLGVGVSRCYLIPRVAVQWLLEALLVERMANKPNGSRQHKQAVQISNLDDVLDLSLRHIPSVCQLRCNTIEKYADNLNFKVYVGRVQHKPYS